MCSCVDWLCLPVLAGICIDNQVPQLPKTLVVVCWTSVVATYVSRKHDIGVFQT
jgi:hypothetical protein